MFPPPPPSGDPRRQRFILKVVVGFLVVTAFLILIAPLRIPRPLRLLLFSTEIFAAVAILLLGRARLHR